MTPPHKQRPSRDNIFMEVAHMFGERSTCPRAQVGAVAVLENRIVATGYNGSPKGQPHCIDVGCQLVVQQGGDPKETDVLKQHCVRAVHAEANLIAWSARVGTSLKGAELYTTHGLCRNCAMLTINAGITVVKYCQPYDESGILYLYDSGIRVFHQESC